MKPHLSQVAQFSLLPVFHGSGRLSCQFDGKRGNPGKQFDLRRATRGQYREVWRGVFVAAVMFPPLWVFSMWAVRVCGCEKEPNSASERKVPVCA